MSCKKRDSEGTERVEELLEQVATGKIGRRDCLAKLVAVGLSAPFASGLLAVVLGQPESAEAQTVSRRAAAPRRARKAVRLKPVTRRDRETVDKLIKLRGVDTKTAAKLRSELDAGLVSWTRIYTEYVESHNNMLVDEAGKVIYETRTPLTDAEQALIDRLGVG